MCEAAVSLGAETAGQNQTTQNMHCILNLFYTVNVNYTVKNDMLISDIKYCSMLEPNPNPNNKTMAWRCKGGVNPYFEMTPEGTYCYTQ